MKDNGNKEFDPVEYLSLNLICQAFVVAYSYLRHFIARARLELFLATTLEKESLKEWLPGRREGRYYVVRNGNLSIDLPRVAENPSLIFRTSLYPMKAILENPFWDNSENKEEFAGAEHLLVRLYSVVNAPTKWVSDALYEKDSEDNIKANNFEYLDERTTRHLTYHFGISDDITEDVKLAGCSWSPCVANEFFVKNDDQRFIPFQIKSDVLDYVLEIKKVNGKTLPLPCTPYVRTNDPNEYWFHIMPQGRMYSIYNARLIAKHKDAQIFFTELIGLAISNKSDETAIWSAFYGGLEAIKRTDFSPLAGHNVYWVLVDKCQTEDCKEKYRVALKVFAALREHGVKFNVTKLENHKWNDSEMDDYGMAKGSYDGIQNLKLDEFFEEAESNGIYVPEDLKPENFGLVNGRNLEKMKDEKYLIEYILRKKSYMVIYAGTGVGKSWMSLSMALALVHGKSVFREKWLSDGAFHKVFYIAGEMRYGEIGERVTFLNESYAASGGDKANFILKKCTYHNLADEAHQEEMTRAIDYASKHEGTPRLKVSAVFLDNLTTLASNGENPSTWDKIFYWICKLQEKGIAVALVHHVNKKGEIRGASKISDKADMVILATKAGDGDKVGILIEPKKIRSEKKSALAPFKAEIDLDAPGEGWKIKDHKGSGLLSEPNKAGTKPKKSKKTIKANAWKSLAEEDRINAIEKAWERGENNTQIAVNYNTSVSTISKFRKKNNLRESDLKKRNENQE